VERSLGEFELEVRRARLHAGLLARLLTTLAGANAIVFGRRIFLTPHAREAIEQDAAAGRRLLAHELTHVRQYRRYGMAAFLGRYVGEYLRARLAGASHRDAYLSISFERDAEKASRPG
jgi:uncharacterized protein DUF4157